MLTVGARSVPSLPVVSTERDEAAPRQRGEGLPRAELAERR
jgi:hypothetical protein